MNMNGLLYYGTDIEVHLGDRVTFRKLWGYSAGIVVYVPGQSALNKSMEYDDVMLWAIQLDGEPGNIRQMGYFPEEEPQAPKKIGFLSRGEENKVIGADEKLL